MSNQACGGCPGRQKGSKRCCEARACVLAATFSLFDIPIFPIFLFLLDQQHSTSKDWVNLEGFTIHSRIAIAAHHHPVFVYHTFPAAGVLDMYYGL